MALNTTHKKQDTNRLISNLDFLLFFFQIVPNAAKILEMSFELKYKVIIQIVMKQPN